MGTKVYTGYRIPYTTDAFVTLKFGFQDKVGPLAQRVFDMKVAQIIAAAIDAQALGKHYDWHDDVTGSTWLSRAGREIVARYEESERTRYRAPSYDFQCYLNLNIPAGEAHSSHILIYLHSEQSAFRELLESIPEVEEYRYWNGTDRPDEISDEEWTRRGEVWSSVLNMRDWMQVQSKAFEHVSELLYSMNTNEIDKHLKSMRFQDRVDREAKARAIGRWIANQEVASNAPLSTYMKLHFEADEFFTGTEEGMRILDETKFEVAELLAPFRELSIEVARNRIPDQDEPGFTMFRK